MKVETVRKTITETEYMLKFLDNSYLYKFT